MHATASTAPHIHEFGELETAVVHVQHSNASEQDEHVPVHRSLDDGPPPKGIRRAHTGRVFRRLFRKRQLLQYFYNDVLFRTRHGRGVSREELFLDLVLVAAIATLGHHLRVSEITWSNIENFLLLFTAIYSAWRQIVLLWNFWGVKEDLFDKICIYFTFVFIVGIAFGAYNPFADKIRSFVSASAFLASFIPIMESAIWASREELLKVRTNRANQVIMGSFFDVISLLPILAAVFVSTEKASKILFWVSLALQTILSILPVYIFQVLHRNVTQYSRPALSIEHVVEKFEVLTMIFLGETVIALLFEGARKSFRTHSIHHNFFFGVVAFCYSTLITNRHLRVCRVWSMCVCIA